MEKLSESELVERIEGLQNTARKISELGDKAREAKETISSVAQTVKGFFVKVGDFFSNLFGKK